jgi:hypothetical protein
MSKVSTQSQELLNRVIAIGAPLEAAGRAGRDDDDGHKPAEPIDREIVMTASRRLRVLADDIKSGLYDAERPNDGR